MVRRLLCLLPALWLAACTAVGPDYRLPSQALVRDGAGLGPFVSTAAGRPAAEALDPVTPLPDHWWRLYDDAMLDERIEIVLAGNVDMRLALAHLQRSQALLAEARSRWTPELQGQASTDYTQQSAQSVLAHVQPPMHGIYNQGVALTRDLDVFGAIRRGIEAGHADLQVAAAVRDRVRLEVVANTVQAYADICNDGHQIDRLQQVIAVQRQQLWLRQALAAQGRLADFEPAIDAARLARREAMLAPLQAHQRNAAYRLAVLSGRVPERYERAWLRCAQPLRLAHPMPTGDGRALLQRRPDVRAAERQLAAATARIGVAVAALYPDIQIGLSVGSSGAISSALGPLTNRFAVGPIVNWDLHRRAVKARIEVARADARARLDAFDATVLQALQDTESSLENYRASLLRQSQLQATVSAAALVAARSQALQRGGRLDALSGLQARQAWLEADGELAAAEAEVNHRQIDCFRALGGGWR